MTKILLVCSGGMSSAIVVKAIEREAAKEGMEVEVKAVGTGEYNEEVKNGWNIVLVAPQVRHRLPVFKEVAKELNIPIEVISPQGYSPLGGKNLMQQIKGML
ncbi:PTS sugar transporter subunit IIB [Paramaledivibacter caminithermalis]|jgi:PTS system cellobiose-specific IIB component|uniref:PTS system, cellobiose-specific IIB component n=1 Tax=Paramaledivibacter caminithermalis (strain DSM 15212 / CIP 107654 / DViRD3) TaxID=1121301 RepID=A0A1M6T6W9_PARC5|nr:PTS sugar transporter subunit IIB [Paramaledivibacter caminithermalis]SHK52599.1 PTS system, cellobiose-specific IIB component [Paramaledivibacter caminithermalis DSM 15212]